MVRQPNQTNNFLNMNSWELLKFPEKNTLDMVKIPLNRKDIKKNDKYRLFLVKPKSENDIVHKIEKTFNQNGMEIRVQFYYKCLKATDNNIWNGTITKILDQCPIESSIPFGKTIPDYYYITLKAFEENVSNTIKLENNLDYKCSIYISEIKDKNLKEINFENDAFKMNLILDWEKMTVNGNILLNISCNKADYHCLLGNKISDKKGLTSTYYHSIRAVYQIIKKNANKYVGQLCPELLSKDSVELLAPKQIEFTYKEIFQVTSFSENFKLGSSARQNVTDWSGQCLDPIVRTMLQPDDTVRCNITYGDQNQYSYRPYFKILDMIDETYFYGEQQDPYYDDEYPKKIVQYMITKIQFSSITEIPLDWLVKSQKEKMEKYLLDESYSMTGASVQ